jgi:hypothetical protein
MGRDGDAACKHQRQGGVTGFKLSADVAEAVASRPRAGLGSALLPRHECLFETKDRVVTSACAAAGVRAMKEGEGRATTVGDAKVSCAEFCKPLCSRRTDQTGPNPSRQLTGYTPLLPPPTSTAGSSSRMCTQCHSTQERLLVLPKHGRTDGVPPLQ